MTSDPPPMSMAPRRRRAPSLLEVVVWSLFAGLVSGGIGVGIVIAVLHAVGRL